MPDIRSFVQHKHSLTAMSCDKSPTCRQYSLLHDNGIADGTDLSSNWLARLCVVKVGSDVELQQLAELSDDVLWGSILVLTPQLAVCFDDLCQLMRQVIFRSANNMKRNQPVSKV